MQESLQGLCYLNSLRVADIVCMYELCVFIARHIYVCVSVCLLYNIHLSFSKQYCPGIQYVHACMLATPFYICQIVPSTNHFFSVV